VVNETSAAIMPAHADRRRALDAVTGLLLVALGPRPATESR